MFSQGSEINCNLNLSEIAAEPVRQCQTYFSNCSDLIQKSLCSAKNQTNLMFSMDSVNSQTNSDLFSQNSETKIHEGGVSGKHFSYFSTKTYVVVTY